MKNFSNGKAGSTKFLDVAPALQYRFLVVVTVCARLRCALRGVPGFSQFNKFPVTNDLHDVDNLDEVGMWLAFLG